MLGRPYVSNWECDSKTKKVYSSKIAEWHKQFLPSEWKLIKKLLSNFGFFSRDQIEKKVVELYEKINELGIDYSKAIAFIPVESMGGVGFSDEFFNQFWMRNDGVRDYSAKNIVELIDSGYKFEKIIIVDDVSGTGKTIQKTIEACIDSYMHTSMPTFVIATMFMTDDSNMKLAEYAKEKNISIEIVYLSRPCKAFDRDVVFPDKECEVKRTEYIKICEAKGIQKNNALGYEDSELLIAFEDTTPNNTLGLFWYSNESYFALFNRQKRKTTTLKEMQIENNKRKKQNRKDFLRLKDSSNINLLYLGGLMASKDTGFSYSDAKQKFGLNEKQLDAFINKLFQGGFIRIEGGSFVATTKLNDLVKINKISTLDNGVENNTFEVKSSDYYPDNFGTVFSGYKNV